MDLIWWFWAFVLTSFLFTYLSYLIPVLYADFFLGPQDLKKKYNAKWALVTGASSGIGRALAEKMAQQGLNVVLVALDDDHLHKTHAELSSRYAAQQFRKVPVDLGRAASAEYNYLDIIAEATKDIDVQIVFNNAGYILLKGFGYTPLDRILANMECNVTSHVKIAHLFFTRMMERKLRGAIAFTSSQTAFFPSPGAAMYCAGKAFLTAFAGCLAIEGRVVGIDVTVLMSGPMRTRFYEHAPKLDVFKFFRI